MSFKCGQWYPIETAAEVARPIEDPPAIAILWLTNETGGEGHWERGSIYRFPDGQVYVIPTVSHGFVATHWMPEPDPPRDLFLDA